MALLEQLHIKLYRMRGVYYLSGPRSIGDTKRMVRAMRKTKREIDRIALKVPMYYKD